jgi:hypothetical protein
MNIDIDEIQTRITECYRPHRDFPKKFEFPPRDASVGPHVIRLTQALGALADAFIEDHDKMTDAVAEIMVASLFVLSILRQPASGVLKEKILIMERAGGRGEPV